MKAGYDEEIIVKMSSERLMAAWAELVAAGQDKPRVAPTEHANSDAEL